MAQEKRHPVDPTRHHRENGWDYRGRAIYHFTLPVEGRYPLFGTLEGESAETAFVMLNPFGRRVYQMIDGLAEFYATRGFALKVLEPLPQSIGAVVRGFKSGCTKTYKEMFLGGDRWATCGGSGGENAAEMHANSGATAATAVPAAAAAPVHFARFFASRGSIWQQDPAHYHERILHAPGQLRRMIDYVKDNPRRLWLKSHNPDLFRLHRHTYSSIPVTSQRYRFVALNEMARRLTDN